MLYQILANFIVVIHFVFICFVVLGGFLVIRWRWMSFLHLASVAWAVLIEFKGWICPLTPLEQNLRHAADNAGYTGGFIEHYITPLIYPEGLTPTLKFAIGTFVLVINLAIYGWLLYYLVYRKGMRHKR